MALPSKKVTSAEALTTISNVLLSAFIFAALYFGRELLVPIALAALLTFLLAPVVTRLQRWLGRVGAVIVVVAMIFAATGAVGWVLTRQAMDLANQLPAYQENIRGKLRAVQFPAGGSFSKVSATFEELKKDLPIANPGDTSIKTDASKRAEEKAMPVKVVNGKNERLEFMQLFVAPVLGPLGTAALVLLLLVFMLIEREDLRSRLIRLVGQGRISATTMAMDDAGSRVARYLLMQLVVNVTYGIPVAVGLYFIGVPNAMLWGALATVLRFIPYLGPWIAAAFPILLSLAVSPGWVMPVLTIALFVVLELFSNNVMEPLLYGSSTGITPIALIVAALVWTWLWGPVGLVLATPLTVCLVVMGRHIPRLSFLSIMLSDEEALTPAEDCYHRLHRTGEHDEMELVDNFLKSNSKEALFDTVLIPVIVAAEMDHRSDLLDTGQLNFIEEGLSDILEDLEMRDAAPSKRVVEEQFGLTVCCLPARTYRDELAGEMLTQLLRDKGFSARTASAKMVAGEHVGWVRETNADIVCISVVPPSTVNHARYLCSKLRASFPTLPIMVGLWTGSPRPEDARVLEESGATEVVTSVAEAMASVTSRATERSANVIGDETAAKVPA